MIKNIIFDIGNVLVDFRWREFLIDKGFTPEEADEIGEATVYTDIWTEYDRGVWTEEEIMNAFVKRAPELESKIRKGFGSFAGMVAGRDYSIPWIKELKAKGYKLYFLSNYSAKAIEENPGVLDFIPLMDGGIFSYRENLVKPDERIYKLLLDRYELKPDECVFMDDTAENVKAAAKVGINVIHFTTQADAIEKLSQLGV